MDKAGNLKSASMTLSNALDFVAHTLKSLSDGKGESSRVEVLSARLGVAQEELRTIKGEIDAAVADATGAPWQGTPYNPTP